MEKERQHFVHGNTEPGHECAGCVANGISEACLLYTSRTKIVTAKLRNDAGIIGAAVLATHRCV